MTVPVAREDAVEEFIARVWSARPAWVLDTLRAVASMRGADPAELGEQVDANAARVFAFDR